MKKVTLTREVFHMMIQEFRLFCGHILLDPFGDRVFIFGWLFYFNLSPTRTSVLLIKQNKERNCIEITLERWLGKQRKVSAKKANKQNRCDKNQNRSR